ncbi:restriction endonuclease [Caballeronia sp. LP003]|uniref:restriction endonuclease n=1 Tax=Caballeronia sp. LP003 TaxID=3038551 RepID=UPI002865E1DE|nr:restriction endonuclease [Caballeronia sp. LP003]MDR5791704.1 restriction endonuclease [Caballeronia sp. LP003]
MGEPKRSRTSLAQRLPWSISAGIAIIATATLLGLANKFEVGGHLEAFRYLPRGAISQLLRVLAALTAMYGAVVAISSLSVARRRARLLDRQSDLASVKRLSWQDFERLVGEAYRREGFHVEEVGLGGADGGVDLILRRRGESTLVQCKRWNVSTVGASVVREMYGLMIHHGAQHVKVVCASGFTRDAKRFAVGKPIELVGGDELMILIRSVRRDQNVLAPTCVCGSPMTKRRSGESIFFGCTRYPICRVTKNHP